MGSKRATAPRKGIETWSGWSGLEEDRWVAAVEQMTDQPPRGEGKAMGRSYDWRCRSDEPRTLTLSVGLQRWVLRP